MRLSIRDVSCTLLALFVIAFTYLQLNGLIQSQLLSDYRIATLVVLITGVLMCIYGAGENIWPINSSNRMIVIAASLGFLALLIGIIGIISGQKLLFVLLAVIIVATWSVSTLRHLAG